MRRAKKANAVIRESKVTFPTGVDPSLAYTAIYLQFFTYFLAEELFGAKRHLGLLAQGGAGAGGTLAHPLQHRSTTLIAGLSATRSRGLAANQQSSGERRVGNRYALPSSPLPNRRLSRLTDSCATLTIHWYK